MESTSGVMGPRITGPRGEVRVPVMDLSGSMSRVGWVTPDTIRPALEIRAWERLSEVPGPVLMKPPSMLPPMITALPASALPPRVLGVLVPISEMVPAWMKLPLDEEGQVKPDGMEVSLAQEWMPPNSWMPIMPAPTPDRPL